MLDCRLSQQAKPIFALVHTALRHQLPFPACNKTCLLTKQHVRHHATDTHVERKLSVANMSSDGGLQVYAVAAYVEGATARREFGIRKRGGFFTEDSSTGEYCDAALDGACSKLLVLQLLRDVSGDTFVQVG